MTRYARYKGNTHRQEHEATEWTEMKKSTTDKEKVQRTENRRLKRQDDKKGKDYYLFIEFTAHI